MMTTPPCLPIELHAEILNGLHHYHDRSTLLSTALVNKEWSTQSQRILFSRMSEHLNGNKWEIPQEHLTSMHMGFLQSIAEHPRRLGPLVHAYAQSHLALNPAISRDSDSFSKSAFDLWELLERALPAMINLKHLKLYPIYDTSPHADNYVSLSALLNSFTFQLETLTWGFFYHPDSGLLRFLRTQKSIIHLGGPISRRTREMILGWLDDGVCPNLVSMTGNLNSLNHVARSRKIIAWKWPRNGQEVMPDGPDSWFGQLKYLSLSHRGYLRRIIDAPDLNITLLEITMKTWEISTSTLLLNMPKLRVLIFAPVVHINSEEMSEIAIVTFRQLPSLEYILLRGYHSKYRHLKLSLSPNPEVEILREELTADYDNWEPWWMAYRA